MIKDKIVIICPASYPVPSVKGGAIETLIENFIDENEILNKCDIILYSYYDEKAVIASEKYKNVEFVYIKVNKNLEKLKNFYIKVAKKLFNKKINNIFISEVIEDINNRQLKKIVVEGNKSYVTAVKDGVKNSKVYFHIHHDAFSHGFLDNEEVAEKSDKIITVSDYITKETLKHCYIENEKVMTLMNCTDVNKFNRDLYLNDRTSLRERYNIKENEVVVLFSGRILKIKGVKELILAFKQHCNDLNAKLLIVGNAGFGKSINCDYDREIAELYKEIEEKIIITGFIHNSEIPKIHAIADIAVVPSLWEEPAGLVVIEAMASGLPLIVTDSGGISEYTNDTCSITIKRDANIVENLGNNLKKLILDEVLRNKMASQARNEALKFNTTNYYETFVEILKDDGDENNEN